MKLAFLKKNFLVNFSCGGILLGVVKCEHWQSHLHFACRYLHEFQPPIVHRDFELGNVLVNDELAVRVADCGLASLLSSDSVTQVRCGRKFLSMLYWFKEYYFQFVV